MDERTAKHLQKIMGECIKHLDMIDGYSTTGDPMDMSEINSHTKVISSNLEYLINFIGELGSKKSEGATEYTGSYEYQPSNRDDSIMSPLVFAYTLGWFD